jgi:hypothetical protein
MTKNQRNIDQYLENCKTVTGPLDLENYVEDSQVEGFLENLDCDEIVVEVKETLSKEACPVCLSLNLIIENRCYTCLECGWSKCSI